MKFVPVSVGESKVLDRYMKHFTTELFECAVVQSFRLSTAEVNLLNFINQNDCDKKLRSSKFTKEKELVVRLSDFRQYYEFLDTCYRKLKQIALSDGQKNRCGFIQLYNESVVPYVVKDDISYLPLFYFEGDIGSLSEQTIDIRDWDLAYLKFCCKMQGIRNTIFGCDVCSVVSLDAIKKYFPEGTTFDDYRLTEVYQRMLLNRSVKQVKGKPWIVSPSSSVASNANGVTVRAIIHQPVERKINGAILNGHRNATATSTFHSPQSCQV